MPPKIRGAPTNYLSVSKEGVAVEGQYFIDLSIPPPAPHIVSEAKNLSLYTTSGAVTADVWVTGNNRLKRVSLKLCSENGRVCAKIVRLVHFRYELSKNPSNKKKNAHSIISSIVVRVNAALPSTLSFGPTMETCHSRYPAVSAGQ